MCATGMEPFLYGRWLILFASVRVLLGGPYGCG